MMNLNDIKGIIEINGESYDPKTILKALVEQGLKIHPLNGSLLVGRTFIDSSPNLKYGSKNCPIAEQCKYYDKFVNQNALQDNNSEFNSSQTSYSSTVSNQIQTSSDHFYTDPIRIDLDDIDITDLFSDNPEITSIDDGYDDGYIPDSKYRSESDPAEMVGLSPLTRYGKTSNIKESEIPTEYRSRCPECQSIVNVRWRFCGSCGTPLD